jgi:hypothetical protein
MRKKNKTKRRVKQPVYTHRDSSGMAWRFEGSRPVSALADQVMREVGLTR